MGNPLTGDYEAVLEVSAGTISRLLATLHRNDRTNPQIPSLPHLVGSHISVGPTRGTMVAQVGVPLITLIDGSTDRFHLQVGIRAEYTPDEGSEPLPKHINGQVGADYLLEPVDPSCAGWRTAAADHVWVRVVDGSVTFDGTATDPFDLWTTIEDTPPDLARIRDVIEILLMSQFAATPHKVSSRFRPGAMRSLDRGGGSAVAVPVSLDGGTPAGSIHSIEQVFLQQSDVAIAIGREAILARIQRVLDDFQANFYETIQLIFKVTVAWWDVVNVNITWGVRVTNAWVEWLTPTGSGGLVRVHVSGGGTTQKAEYDWSFEVSQDIHLSLDARTGWFGASPQGDPTVTLSYDGPYADEAKAAAQPKVEASLKAQIQSLAGGVGADLGLSARATELAQQLRSLDPAASVDFGWTRFTEDGVVIFGGIGLSPDRPWKITFTKNPDGDGYTALRAWVPGGRIDRYRWTWHWQDGGKPDGKAQEDDRWTLRRPTGGGMSKFGIDVRLTSPLPGIDGAGSVRLTATGVYVDDETGEVVPFTASSDPVDYTLDPHWLTDKVVTTRIPNGGTTGERIHEGLTVLVGGGGPSDYGTKQANTLIVRAGRSVDASTLAARVQAGLTGATVEGAGLQVAVLVDGSQDDVRLTTLATALHAALGDVAPVVVSEDVDGSWGEGLNLPTDPGAEWCALISPNGGVPWAHEGEVDGEQLTGALETFLMPSERPRFERVTQGVDRDMILLPWVLDPGIGDGCPPPPVGRLGKRSVITFVRPRSAAARQALTRVRTELAPDPDETFVAVVVHGEFADATDVQAAGLHPDALPIADPQGVIAQRFGIRVWPTTVLVDEEGAVVRVLTGAGDGPLDPPADRSEEARA